MKKICFLMFLFTFKVSASDINIFEFANIAKQHIIHLSDQGELNLAEKYHSVKFIPMQENDLDDNSFQYYQDGYEYSSDFLKVIVEKESVKQTLFPVKTYSVMTLSCVNYRPDYVYKKQSRLTRDVSVSAFLGSLETTFHSINQRKINHDPLGDDPSSITPASVEHLEMKKQLRNLNINNYNINYIKAQSQSETEILVEMVATGTFKCSYKADLTRAVVVTNSIKCVKN